MIDNIQDQTPEIDYLSKDYASFRRLMLDHIALRIPDWNEPSEADLGNVLVEILAYAADYLSYYQDAVATEAYLGTARLRPSVKRHVRMLDYVLQEGCNARVWVHLHVNEPVLVRAATQLLSHIKLPGNSILIPPNSPVYLNAIQQQHTKVFETMHDSELFPEHNDISFYAEDGVEVILPTGATEAFLKDAGQDVGAHKPGPGAKELAHAKQAPLRSLRLRVGDVLVFEEVVNVHTGSSIGIDPTHRHAVRLTQITRSVRGGVPVMHVKWADADALPFPLGIAVRIDGDIVLDVSRAHGNIILADQGLTIRHEQLPAVPANPQQRYRPYLRNIDLTHAVPYDHEQALHQPACAALVQDRNAALPEISLFQESSAEPISLDNNLTNGSVGGQFSAHAGVASPTPFPGGNSIFPSEKLHQVLKKAGVVLSQRVEMRAVPGVGLELNDRIKKRHWLMVEKDSSLFINTYKKWMLQRDLLSSGPLACDYTVDIEEDGRARLRFGFEEQGQRPVAGDRFVTTYRTGMGTKGNLRADTISHIVTTDVRISAVRNPLAAQGGSDPVSIEEVRIDAPYAFSSQERCVTESDYAQIARKYPGVVNAVAQLRWTGSWHTAFVYIQRHNGRALDADFIAGLTSYMEDFRLLGYEIEVRSPYFAALNIVVTVHLKKGAAQSTVFDALSQAFSNRAGGFFAPDQFTFGQTVYLSKVMSRAMDVPGVMQVEVEQFCRFGTAMPSADEQIHIGPLEIARLDNDPNKPQNGRITFHLKGGL